MGVSRESFYCYKKLINESRLKSLITKIQWIRNLKNRVDDLKKNNCLSILLLIAQFMINIELVVNNINKIFSFRLSGFTFF